MDVICRLEKRADDFDVLHSLCRLDDGKSIRRSNSTKIESYEQHKQEFLSDVLRYLKSKDEAK